MLTEALKKNNVFIQSHNIKEKKSNPNLTTLSGWFEQVSNSKNVTIKFGAEIF